jgi:hypothetical protein
MGDAVEEEGADIQALQADKRAILPGERAWAVAAAGARNRSKNTHFGYLP